MYFMDITEMKRDYLYQEKINLSSVSCICYIYITAILRSNQEYLLILKNGRSIFRDGQSFSGMTENIALGI